MPRKQRQIRTTADAGALDGTEGVEKALFDQATTGLEVYDLGLRILRANDAVLAMRGLPADAVIGAGLKDLDSGIPLSPIMEEVLTSGCPVLDRPVTVCPGADSGIRRDYAVTGYILRCTGQSVGVASVIQDVTSQVRTQRELDLLNIARAKIGSTLDAVATAQEFAEMAVPTFADAVAVDLFDSVLVGDAPVGPITARMAMRRAAFKARAGDYGAYPVGGFSGYAFPTPYTQALSDLRPRLIESVPAGDAWLAHDRMRVEFLARTGVRSLIVTPLTVHGLVLGLASFYRAGSSSEPFDEKDVSLATQLASRTAMCVDNARRFTREHTVATTLQRSLLPRVPPDVAAVEASHCTTPGRYGAHWFDVLPLSSCRVGLMIGYVPGEDLQASSVMGRLRTAGSALAEMDLPPDEMLTHLDDVAQRLAREQDTAPETLHEARAPLTATCLYMTYDPVTRRCEAASAGHDSPLLTSPEGVVSTFEVPRGAPLGQGVPYEVRTAEVPERSLLTLYSDGSAKRYPAEFGERLSRLRKVVADSVAGPWEITDSAVYEVLRDVIPPDGAALLVARTRSLEAGHVFSRTFPAEPASVCEARKAARKQLTQWGLEEHTTTTDLVVSELATNVISHAKGAIRMRLIFDRTLTIEVSDNADTAPHLRHARLQDEGGRGLFIVASLVRNWGTRYEDSGKTIWAEQALTPA
ncbi:SpoIIE family protein phosphatase [Streptomyces sp. NPDC058691]|uniref:ATP-binding SpoIIE family protein phosphatase n=1 Tax=Streptomyces sp. NPDC058691 TaxID=3346601 RepID=UPI0036465E08